jgi:hypothetical protein
MRIDDGAAAPHAAAAVGGSSDRLVVNPGLQLAWDGRSLSLLGPLQQYKLLIVHTLRTILFINVETVSSARGSARPDATTMSVFG